MTWFIEKPDRFVSERRAVAALAGSESWLSHYAFRFDEGIRLVLRFTLRVAETDIQLDLRYPRFYPETPPEVVPLDGELKLSAHQWAGGALCLQHRTDNWLTDVNAADLIRSAYELLTADVTGRVGHERFRHHMISPGASISGLLSSGTCTHPSSLKCSLARRNASH